jgi:hypothetical protein
MAGESSNPTRAWKPGNTRQLPRWRQGRATITSPVNLKITSFGPWKRASETIPDASNLYQAPEDILEAAGVIEDDRQVESHDGSRRVCMCDTCDERPFWKGGKNKGQRKPDCGAVKRCPFPRVEIVIEPLNGEECE